MVIKPPRNWVRELFSVRGTILVESLPQITITTVVAFLVTMSEHYVELGAFDLTPVPFSLTGVAIGIFLGFRGKTAYDRFWEGRIQWAALINCCRNLGRQILTLPECPADQTETLKKWQVESVYFAIAFAHALRHQLRNTEPWDDLKPLLDPKLLEKLKVQRNVPLALNMLLSRNMTQAIQKGWIDPRHILITDRSLSEMVNVQGGCERIRNTPVPYAYGALSHRVVAVFCLFLPFGIVHTAHTFTPLVTLIVSYAFFGLDSLGAEIEEPFGMDHHDLPLSALCRTVEINLRQQLEESDLPEVMTPVDYILS